MYTVVDFLLYFPFILMGILLIFTGYLIKSCYSHQRQAKDLISIKQSIEEIHASHQQIWKLINSSKKELPPPPANRRRRTEGEKERAKAMALARWQKIRDAQKLQDELEGS